MKRVLPLSLSALVGSLIAALVMMVVWRKAPVENPSGLAEHRQTGLTLQRSGSTSAENKALRALQLQDDDERRNRLIEALSAWAEVDGLAAMTWAKAHLSEPDYQKVRHDVVATWAWHDPEGIQAWFRDGFDENDPLRDGGWLAELIVKSLALKDPAMAAQFHVHDTGVLTGRVAYGQPGRDLANAVRSADDCRRVCEAYLPYYEKFQSLSFESRLVLGRWHDLDPEAAEAFELRYPDPEESVSEKAGSEIVHSTDRREKGDELLQESGDGVSERANTIENVVNVWPTEEFNNAAAWLKEQGDGEETRRARRLLAVRGVSVDPALALSLLEPEGTATEPLFEEMIVKWPAKDRDRVMAFLDSQEGLWPAERLQRLREISVVGRGW